MRILLTGASGFIGSHLLAHLISTGRHQVAVLMRDPGSAWRVQNLLGRVTVIRGDLELLGGVLSAVCDFQPDTVVHPAWAGVAARYRNNRVQYTNIQTVMNLVDLAYAAGVSHWIGVGSQAEYEPSDGPLNEESPTRPTTLYGIAKLAAGLTASQLCLEAGIRFAWIRLFSAYGPQDDAEWMIPTLIRCLLMGARPPLTAGTQVWDYLYVGDVARAIERVATTPTATGVFNLGSGRPLTIRRVAEIVRDRIDSRLPLGFGELPFRPDQVMHLEADIRRIHAATGWMPEVDLTEGIDRTIDHVRLGKIPSSRR